MRSERSTGPVLAWSGHDSVFISHADGSHVLVAHDDPRALSVPHVEEIQRFGSEEARNLLVEGDGRAALRALRLSSVKRSYSGKVKLAYLDPPFNTQEVFANYHDALDHGVWLTMMRSHLVELRELITEDGSLWVHCDDHEQAYLRVLMDEVFGRESFVATVVWQRRYSRDNRRAIGPVQDYIHVYSPLGQRWKDVRNRLPRRDKDGTWTNPDDDPKGAWSTHSLVAQGGHGTPAQFYDITTPSGRVVTPPIGSCWRVTRQRFDQLVDEGRIWFGRDGANVPRKRVYLSEAQGLVPWSWWPHEEVGHNDEARREMAALFPGAAPFLTPKPERLLERILKIGTNEGDLVLDCFLGSGTTAAVAHKMRRQWIGIELRPETVKMYALPRLQAVVAGADEGGISEQTGWTGGGSFVFARAGAIRQSFELPQFELPQVAPIAAVSSLQLQLSSRQ